MTDTTERVESAKAFADRFYLASAEYWESGRGVDPKELVEARDAAIRAAAIAECAAVCQKLLEESMAQHDCSPTFSWSGIVCGVGTCLELVRALAQKAVGE